MEREVEDKLNELISLLRWLMNWAFDRNDGDYHTARIMGNLAVALKDAINARIT